MRRACAVVVLALLGLLAGCARVVYPYQPTPHAGGWYRTMWPVVDPDGLGVEQLCPMATAAVQQILTDRHTARNDAELVRQTVASYHQYASKLRELAARANTVPLRARIQRAADEAEAYARAVDRTQDYIGPDLDPTIQASEDAFPGCDLDG